MDENPNSINTDIEATRTRLAEELTALSEKMSPTKAAGRTVEDAKIAIAHTWERMATGAADARVRLAGATEDLAPRASATAQKAKDSAGRAVHRVGQNPHFAGNAQHVRDAASQTAAKVSHNPRVTATAEKVRESTVRPARTMQAVRQQAVNSPRATRATAAAMTGVMMAAVLVIIVRGRRCARR
ncbi:MULTISPECIES: DUF3618 domain-containing protein [unclassified Frankia]|uniref:DUF3618 domain-containing protein n=2 Tax=Frankia TaxID=1854 RepID=UPI001EF43751|nr:MULTISPECIES: DUF3618 domain-containing protein [unclassified Frankia]